MQVKYFVGLITLGLTIFGCTYQNVVLAPKINYDQASIDLTKELTPQLVGRWNLRQVKVKYQSYNQRSEIGVSQDTTFQNLAVLTVVRSNQQRDSRYGEFEGTIEYNRKKYPVKFYLLASYEWFHKKTGPQASFLFVCENSVKLILKC